MNNYSAKLKERDGLGEFEGSFSWDPRGGDEAVWKQRRGCVRASNQAQQVLL